MRAKNNHQQRECPMNTPKQKPEAATDANDSFPDLSKLRLSQEFLETAGAKKILTTVPVHKPRTQAGFRAGAS
jgi:hypothetical protein